jgi:hypothetical protein
MRYEKPSVFNVMKASAAIKGGGKEIGPPDNTSPVSSNAAYRSDE